MLVIDSESLELAIDLLTNLPPKVHFVDRTEMPENQGLQRQL